MASTTTPLSALASLLRDGENVISPYVRDTDEEPGAKTARESSTCSTTRTIHDAVLLTPRARALLQPS